ncbi:MAG: hypothetical protein P8H03_08925 [Emcibacteraceae bacterium]|nr:hypothetical protein [Emcibacteraceae bacterium]MDG1858658.1 hypothetical protein [Emcibacteraceae bacterium]
MEKLTKWQKAMLMIIGVPLGLYLMYTLAYPTYSWNQKLTVEVETPEGVVSGSSVVGVEVEFQPDLGFVEIASIYHDWHGEATIVELPNDQYGAVDEQCCINEKYGRGVKFRSWYWVYGIYCFT